MEENKERPPVYKRYTDINIDMYVHGEERENKLLRGRGLLNPQKAEFLFLENKPPENRSAEIGRTLHARFIRKPNGAYTVTLRFSAAERLIREQLLAELRNIMDVVMKDYEKITTDLKLKKNGKKHENESVQSEA